MHRPIAVRPTLAFAFDPERYAGALDSRDLARLATIADVLDDEPMQTYHDARAARLLAEADILVTGWRAPLLDTTALAMAPRLKLVGHLAATVKQFLSEDVWHRGISVTAAVNAVALPVVEFTLASIVFAAKRAFTQSQQYRQHREISYGGRTTHDCGLLGKTVGILGASRVGMRVIERLRDYDLEVLVYDPYLAREHAIALGAEKVDNLDDMIGRCDILSVHAPITDETINILDARRLALLQNGATLINTARGVLIDHAALVKELLSGRISASLDVTYPEPLPKDSPLFDLPNVFLTPHIAGPQGSERRRMLTAIINDIERYVAGKPLLGDIAMTSLARIG
ncbi:MULTISPECIES: hydroxyacid dehydrogenase [unclassified Chelatococcus]|uniref:hydroxyacid dehydrogenase n=1 Tax=unclassified Chelatococcus TaxID=2638111 RepID=UPI001BD0406C|nr:MULTISPECIES: hydroxyacid dehydrogenase [unclassified Chelatococcus]CAH1648442.1 Phosphoglycerate dehydrogenase-like enzyme [Hyphomicrobiales bacterium]MBS7741943.1 hydroxyacid dehydrogenase [Chelatococcus sp. HY11]MBX3541259.1 hydroxyacid dehydrogenase [Chelatococcus sp.]MCO5074848.1 hydroxyacid dehydrogenase [Chelatococcus sp.]CAH1691013.1 Phosphoglycerate dehydrogenase-like enzyme [Hyphomicrobiales bacterium]